MLALLKSTQRPKLHVVKEGYAEFDKSTGRHVEVRKTRGQGVVGFLEALIRSENPPWFDARGAAVGLMIGFGLPIGLQMLALALLRLCFRFNAVIAFTMTWVNNPFSLIPLYYGYYYLGSQILGRSVVMSVEDFRALMQPILSADYFWGSVQAFLLMSWDILERWAVAAIILAAVSGLLGYVAAYRIQQKRCKRRAIQMGISYERLLRGLEKSVEDRGKLDR